MIGPEPTSEVAVVGGGLAGSEAAFQLAEMGYRVRLYEMRPHKLTPAHKTGNFAELVCSNSFGSFAQHSAPGQLKWEAEQLGSKVLECAWQTYVPAGQALAIDRQLFGEIVSRLLRSHPRISVVSEEVRSLADVPRPCIIATGPLTTEPLALSLRHHFGDQFLYFFDAIAPIVDGDSINYEIVWRADRYDKGSGDYLNCPLTKEQYEVLVAEIASAEKVEPKDFEKDTPYFAGCMPIEEIVRRGPETLRYGCLSGKGLDHPKTGRWPYAVVQLRKENKAGTAYNMVGFQTKMKYPEQKRVFRLIPGLENAEFLKLGSIHRNLYIHSPQRLNPDLSSKQDPWLFFAGQITGVEGYFESTMIGLMVAKFIDQKLTGREPVLPPRETAIGSLLAGITQPEKTDFQPTNINFGLYPPINDKLPKRLKKELQNSRAKEAMIQWLKINRPAVTTKHFVPSAAATLLET